MKTSEILRKAAKYVRVHGFDFDLGLNKHPRCFVGAIASAVANDFDKEERAANYLVPFVGAWDAKTLCALGWNKNDAIAALEIAADCAQAEGK